jgi:GTPase SAR1 family protein
MSAKKVESSAVTCKVILIGQSGVGKSSITNRYVINTFTSNLNPTHGASFATKVVNYHEHDKLVKFDVKK